MPVKATLQGNAVTIHIAALASGTGSNIGAMIAAIADGRLDARISLILANNPEAGVLDIAREAGLPVWARSHKDYASREAFDRAMLDRIRESGADTVVLAGYMRLLSPFFVQAYSNRMLNIHPAILPSFPGVHSARQALAYGVRFSGPSVHFVDEEMDNGPLIIQAVVPVDQSDTEETLMGRIQAMEHRIYPQALQWLAEGRLRLQGRRVELLPGIGGERSLASQGAGDMGPWMVCPALEGF